MDSESGDCQDCHTEFKHFFRYLEDPNEKKITLGRERLKGRKGKQYQSVLPRCEEEIVLFGNAQEECIYKTTGCYFSQTLSVLI